jgi:hypothetical protein
VESSVQAGLVRAAAAYNDPIGPAKAVAEFGQTGQDVPAKVAKVDGQDDLTGQVRVADCDPIVPTDPARAADQIVRIAPAAATGPTTIAPIASLTAIAGTTGEKTTVSISITTGTIIGTTTGTTAITGGTTTGGPTTIGAIRTIPASTIGAGRHGQR